MPNDIQAVQRQTAQYDLFNRLHSIASDERFVQRTAAAYGGRFEVIANQRCGTWYCDPSSSSAAYAYFKSTDGHTNNWAFNLRRSNLPLAELAQDKGGLILVDSTRRGKRTPDALSKTVPIWCTVINRAVAGREGYKEEEWQELYTPPSVVSATEKVQIEGRLDGWVEALEKSTLKLPRLIRPLRPFWIHPSTTQPPHSPDDPPFVPIICVSASRWVGGEDDVPAVTKLGDRTVGFSYVQGAGDDDELWSRGLTPSLFHRHKERLLSVDRDDLAEEVDELVRGNNAVDVLAEDVQAVKLDSPTTNITTGVPHQTSRLGVSIGPSVRRCPWWPTGTIHTIYICPLDKPRKGDKHILRASSASSIFACPSARSHPGAFFYSLDGLVNHVEDIMDDDDNAIELRPGSASDIERARTLTEEATLNLTDPQLSIDEAIEARRTILPLALVLLLSIPDLGNTSIQGGPIDKGRIADTLHQLVALWPDGNPPRAALRRVNEYLMSTRS